MFKNLAVTLNKCLNYSEFNGMMGNYIYDWVLINIVDLMRCLNKNEMCELSHTLVKTNVFRINIYWV